MTEILELLLDVDGVVADFNVLLEEFPLEIPEDPPWNFIDLYPPDVKEEVLERLADPAWWARLPVIEGAHEGVNYLRGVGYDIKWVTAPWQSCPGWAVVRKAWLARNFQVDPDEVNPTSEKHLVDGDRMVDDKPSNITEWSKAHPQGVAILFDSRFNRNFDWPHRMTWETVSDHL